ncbi:MAG: NADH dehydrogenase (quinone) subunit D [Candidatus Poribacteria bacterium]|nr:NADH dehydrogenase (quinone) subunit D [Candidatus Poribacteria bacterium]
MSEEQAVVEEEAEAGPTPPLHVGKLQEAFGDAVLAVDHEVGEWTVYVSADKAHDILAFLKEDVELQYSMMTDLTAVDYSKLDEIRARFGARYHVLYSLYSFANRDDADLKRLRVKAPLTGGESIRSVVDVYPAANWAEREVYDMFGIAFDGHPDLRRILMPDYYVHHPLRKDYPTKGLGERESFDFDQMPSTPVYHSEHLDHANSDGLKSETMVLNFGPQHPATHGTLHLEVELDGEEIVNVMPHLGYLHTGFEKLGESMHWNQYIVVTDRMNYLSPLSNNFAYVLAVEKLMGMEVPKRGQYIRVMTAELTRIADHMVWFGTHALDIGAFTVFLWAFQEREKIYDILEACSGARLTVSYTRVGGVLHDVPDSFEPMVRTFLKYFKEKGLPEMEGMLNKNRIWIDRTKGVGVISAEKAISLGLTGPCLRGSGVDWDIRKAEPYSSYDDFDFDIPTGATGDTYDRYLVRLEELKQSCRIVEQALNNLPGGPVNVDDHKVKLGTKDHVYKMVDHEHPYDPKHPYGSIEGMIHHFKLVMDDHGLHPPKGEAYSATESPNGELGFYVVSDGSGHPYRVRVRPPSFYNFATIPHLLRGHMVADIVTVLGSINVIAGELDR